MKGYHPILPEKQQRIGKAVACGRASPQSQSLPDGHISREHTLEGSHGPLGTLGLEFSPWSFFRECLL